MKAHALNAYVCRRSFAFKVNKISSQEIFPERFLSAFIVFNSRPGNKRFRDECKYGLRIVRNSTEKYRAIEKDGRDLKPL